jgi:hypothetical protein
VFGFAFSASAFTTVKSKIPDKFKVEKEIFTSENSIALHCESEQLKVICNYEEKILFPCSHMENFIYKENKAANYIADISRKQYKKLPSER